MLSIYIESFIAFCVIIVLLWFDFQRNIPCFCYSITLSSWYSSRNRSKIDIKYPSCLNPPYLMLHRCEENLHDIYWFSAIKKPIKIYIICILNFNVNLYWLVGGESSVFFLKFCFSCFVSLALQLAAS